MRTSVELIIPGLFNLPSHELDRKSLQRGLPSLNTILRYAKRVTNKAYELDSMLAESLNLSGDQRLPLARAFVEGPLPGEDSYLLCQAVYLKPDMHNAIVLPLDNNEQTLDDITLLFSDLNNQFKVNCHMEFVSNKLYLMQVKHCEVPDNHPHYLTVLGKKTDQYIEQSKQMLPWYRLINEIQMFLHTHEVNHRRLENGLLAINSLWCWGSGPLPVLADNSAHWYADDLVLRRFADKLGIANSELEVFADAEAGAVKHAVCIDLSILETLKSVRDESLMSLLGRMEQQLFKPVVGLARSGKSVLRLRTGDEFDFNLSAYSSLKFWRKTQDLCEFRVE